MFYPGVARCFEPHHHHTDIDGQVKPWTDKRAIFLHSFFCAMIPAMNNDENADPSLRDLAKTYLRDIMLGAELEPDPLKMAATTTILKHVSPEEEAREAVATEGPMQKILKLLKGQSEDDKEPLVDEEFVRAARRG